MMQDIKQLQLSDHDFKLIVEGLDALPERGAASEILGDVFGAMLLKDPVEIEKAKRDKDQRLLKEKGKKEMLIEDIRILQGKLIQFRRYLQQEGLLVEANEILNQR